MIVYHASYTEITAPDTSHSRKYLDFGPGFYVTIIPEQAVKYAERFSRRGKDAWINTYELSDDYSKRYAILESKYSRIISEISALHNISLEKAMDMFYKSDTFTLIEDGVADLHCRSDKYLAEEVWREMTEKEENK